MDKLWARNNTSEAKDLAGFEHVRIKFVRAREEWLDIIERWYSGTWEMHLVEEIGGKGHTYS